MPMSAPTGAGYPSPAPQQVAGGLLQQSVEQGMPMGSVPPQVPQGYQQQQPGLGPQPGQQPGLLGQMQGGMSMPRFPGGTQNTWSIFYDLMNQPALQAQMAGAMGYGLMDRIADPLREFRNRGQSF